MPTKNYYLLKKDDKEYRLDTKAAVYEMYDCLGRGEVTIEYHKFDTDAQGILKEYIETAHKIRRRTLKSGEIKYYMTYIGIYKED